MWVVQCLVVLVRLQLLEVLQCFLYVLFFMFFLFQVRGVFIESLGLEIGKFNYVRD